MKLINLSDVGIKGINYYWTRRVSFNITVDELREAGVTGGDGQVDERLVPRLKEANRLLKDHGYEIMVKDGYRSPELYQLVQAKRYESDGKANTDRTLNVVTMPHSTGLVVDINLVNLANGEECEMWSKSDWPDGIFVDYYRSKKDDRSREYQRLQDLLISTMLKVGFTLGTKNEIWHFEYN